MSNLFELDNPVMRFLFKACDLLILNLLFIFTSLPVFTIGASLTALYSVTLKMVRGEEGYIVKSYFKAFAQNFKQSTLLWVSSIIFFFFLWYDYLVIFSKNILLFQILKFLFLIIVLLYSAVFLYIWPITSYFVCSTKQVLKNALFMSLGFLPWTILMLTCFGLIIYLSTHFSLFFIFMVASSMFISFSLIGYLTSLIFYKLFKKFHS